MGWKRQEEEPGILKQKRLKQEDGLEPHLESPSEGMGMCLCGGPAGMRPCLRAFALDVSFVWNILPRDLGQAVASYHDGSSTFAAAVDESVCRRLELAEILT